jgi:hypothetical protein
MSSLFDEIAKTIKKKLPNALISWDIRPSLNETEMKIWWRFFDSSIIDFIHTSGAKSHGDSNFIGGDFI